MNSPGKGSRLLKNLIVEVNNSDISSIKETVTQLIRIINDPKSSADDLKHAIEIDPPLSAKLVKIVRSAYYGYTKEINDIREAIVCIGFDTIKELALNQKVFNLFKEYEYIYGYTRISLWKHCIAVAICGKLIYRSVFRQYDDTIYIAGLLHDIGYIVVDQFLPKEFKEILKKSRFEKKSLIDAEKEILGFTHADIGKRIAEEWGFPDSLVYAIANHHSLYPEQENEEYQKIAYTIYAADYACQRKNIGYDENFHERKNLFQKCRIKLKLTEKAIDYIIEKVENEITKMEEAGFF
ncbi:hypothetical protein AMJ80_04015 [bacterium SM23_31]|nr:MAG: hypothetical protein AMJ80_04015 [bacterium SM23_31]